MKNPLRFLLPVLVCCLILGSLAPTLAQDAKSDIASLFEGVPPDLRANIRTNSVRMDRVNDWLIENVDGKGKVIEVELPVRVKAVRDADKTYSVEFIERSVGGGFGGGGFDPNGRPLAISVTLLGGTWPVTVSDGRGNSRDGGFGFVGVSAADAEKLVELKKTRIQGKAKRVRLGAGRISVVLDDVLVDGQKLTPRAEPRMKGNAAAVR